MHRRPSSPARWLFLLLVVLAVSAGLSPEQAPAQERLAAPDWVDPQSDKVPPDILVYYFHNTFRCLTCLTMENMAEELIRDEFAADLECGVLAWRSVNLQEMEYEYFKDRYSLDGPSLVIVEWGENKEVRWKNLKRIWELADDPAKYQEYVRGELAVYLNGEPGGPVLD